MSAAIPALAARPSDRAVADLALQGLGLDDIEVLTMIRSDQVRRALRRLASADRRFHRLEAIARRRELRRIDELFWHGDDDCLGCDLCRGVRRADA